MERREHGLGVDGPAPHAHQVAELGGHQPVGPLSGDDEPERCRVVVEGRAPVRVDVGQRGDVGGEPVQAVDERVVGRGLSAGRGTIGLEAQAHRRRAGEVRQPARHAFRELRRAGGLRVRLDRLGAVVGVGGRSRRCRAGAVVTQRQRDDDGHRAHARRGDEHGRAPASVPAASSGARRRPGVDLGRLRHGPLQQVAELLRLVHASSWSVSSAERRRAASAREVWLLTVPTLMPSAAAVWASVRSS